MAVVVAALVAALVTGALILVLTYPLALVPLLAIVVFPVLEGAHDRCRHSRNHSRNRRHDR